jgi:hypothetical protein
MSDGPSIDSVLAELAVRTVEMEMLALELNTKVEVLRLLIEREMGGGVENRNN